MSLCMHGILNYLFPYFEFVTNPNNVHVVDFYHVLNVQRHVAERWVFEFIKTDF